MALGIGGKIKKTVKTFGEQIEGEAKRSFAMSPFFAMREKFRESRRERKRMEAEAAELSDMRRRQLEEQRYRQSQQQRMVAAEKTRERRLSAAESIVGEAVGMMSSTPTDGPNMAVNNIPVLNEVDDMGNSIPEV